MTQLHDSPTRGLARAHCRHCAHEMVLLPRTGWVVLHPGDSYDICPAHEDGPHEPEPAVAEVYDDDDL